MVPVCGALMSPGRVAGRRFKADGNNPQQQKIVENVRNYLHVFLKLCKEDQANPTRKPSLKALDGCKKMRDAGADGFLDYPA